MFTVFAFANFKGIVAGGSMFEGHDRSRRSLCSFDKKSALDSFHFLAGIILGLVLLLTACQPGVSSTQPEPNPALGQPTPVIEISPTMKAEQPDPSELPPVASSTLTPTMLPTTLIQPTPTLEARYYLNEFSGTTTGLEGWTLYEVPFNRHWTLLPDNFPDVQNNTKAPQIMDAFDQVPVYAIYDQHLWSVDMTLDETFEFSGQGEASHALICRFSNSGWYEIGLSSSGNWKISLMSVDGQDLVNTTLLEGTLSAIPTGSINLRVNCLADQVGLQVNGQEIATVTDAALQQGDLFGFVYQEEAPSETQVQISKLTILDGKGNKLREWSNDADSFYFNKAYFAVSKQTPQNVRSIMSGYTTIEIEEGQARLRESQPGWVLLINPMEMPRDVEISMTVTSNDLDHNIGILCNWSPENGGYLLWYRNPYSIITPFDIDEHGVPLYRGGNWEFMTTAYGNLLSTKTHQITAFCGVGMTKLFIDGQQVMSAPLSDFKAPDNNKAGRMIGLAFGTNVTDTASILIDNLMVSWRVPTPTPSGE